MAQVPLDSDGVCMLCKEKPSEEATLCCATCATPWHVACLSEIKNSAAGFECPDCSGDGLGGAPAPANSEKKELFDKIREIEADPCLSEAEKARKRQELLGGKMGSDEGEDSGVKEDDSFDIMEVIGQTFKCSYCMELPERPVTTPCGHNFCLKCFEKWIKQGRHTCVKCRSNIPNKMASRPHINSTLVAAIRMAKLSRTITSAGPQTVYRFIHDQDRPDAAFVTDRAQKPGLANAKSGRIFVTLPHDHFGPITAEDDPERNLGVLVGETWGKRIEARQWGVHYPPIAGISGKAHRGSPSIVISGGYEDDEDHGEWFIYTGSGGRDLDNNRRTNKEQSGDQEFKDGNQALRVSCIKGYPVRVMRSEKDKRSPYAPEEGYRYDGIYRVEKCWRIAGMQGFIVCRYLLVRCDNEPAPWTSDEHGDRPRKMPVIAELEESLDLFERVESPSWDYDEADSRWKWKKPPPPSEAKQVVHVKPEERAITRNVIRKAQTSIIKERLLKATMSVLSNLLSDLGKRFEEIFEEEKVEEEEVEVEEEEVEVEVEKVEVEEEVEVEEVKKESVEKVRKWLFKEEEDMTWETYRYCSNWNTIERSILMKTIHNFAKANRPKDYWKVRTWMNLSDTYNEMAVRTNQIKRSYHEIIGGGKYLQSLFTIERQRHFHENTPVDQILLDIFEPCNECRNRIPVFPKSLLYNGSNPSTSFGSRTDSSSHSKKQWTPDELELLKSTISDFSSGSMPKPYWDVQLWTDLSETYNVRARFKNLNTVSYLEFISGGMQLQSIFCEERLSNALHGFGSRGRDFVLMKIFEPCLECRKRIPVFPNGLPNNGSTSSASPSAPSVQSHFTSYEDESYSATLNNMLIVVREMFEKGLLTSAQLSIVALKLHDFAQTETWKVCLLNNIYTLEMKREVLIQSISPEA